MGHSRRSRRPRVTILVFGGYIRKTRFMTHDQMIPSPDRLII